MLNQTHNMPITFNFFQDFNLHSQNQQLSFHQQQQTTLINNPAVLRIQIDLDNGKTQTLQIKQDDDPSMLACKLCFDNNLDMKIISKLTKNIKNIMDESFGGQQLHKKYNQNESNLTTQKSQLNLNETKKEGINTKRQNKKGYSPNVFDRLYSRQKSKKKHQESNKAQQTIKVNKKNTNLDSLINNGVLIYEKNKRLYEENKKKMKQINEQLKNSEFNRLTFRPQINLISKMMIEKLKEFSPQQSIQQRNQRIKQEKIIQLKIKKQKQQLKQCTFKPKTNHSQSNCKSTDRFNNLYEDFFSRAAKKDKLKSDIQKSYQFQPQINPISQMLTKGMKFNQRLKKYQQQKNLKEDKIQKQKDFKEIMELETGQLLFQPKVGRPPGKRNQQNLPVYQHLYNARNSIRQKKIDNNHSVTTVQNSSRIYQIRKIESIQQIFQLLDSDCDGMISFLKMDLKKIEPKVIKLLNPLINQMEQMNAILSEDQFIQAVQRLFKTLNVQDKNTIIKHNKKKKCEENNKFRPQLNQKSLAMVRKTRPIITPGVSIYQYCQIKKLEKELKIKQEKQRKGKQQLQQCTFKPKIITNINKTSALRN